MQDNKPLPARYDSIDLIECIAMLFVVMYHSTTVPYDFNQSAYECVNYFIRAILSTCVPLFFFANGYLLINKKFDLKKHLKKTVRLIILTFVWGAINLLFIMRIENEWLTVKEFFDALWTWKQGWINHFWFMGALVCIYLFFPLIKMAYDNNAKTLLYWVTLCVILAFGNEIICMCATMYKYFIAGDRQYVVTNYFNMFHPLRGLYVHTLAYFGIGCLVGSNKSMIDTKVVTSRICAKPVLYTLLCISTCCLGLWGVFSSKVIGTVWNGYDTAFTLVNVCIIYLLSVRYTYRSGNPLCKLIRTISCNTFGIYVLHEIFLHLLNRLGIKSFAFMQNYISNLIYAAVIMLICTGISLAMKKIPIIKKLV